VSIIGTGQQKEKGAKKYYRSKFYKGITIHKMIAIKYTWLKRTWGL